MTHAIEARLAEIERRLDVLEGGRTEWPPPDRYVFSKQSLDRLQGVHPDLLAVTHYALRVSKHDFGIPRTGGVRTPELQRELLAAGKSKTMRSRHLTGHAVDIYGWVDGSATWSPPIILAIHDAFMLASEALDVPLRWGGDWDRDGIVRERGENDLVHHELPRSVYGEMQASLSARAAEFLASV